MSLKHEPASEPLHISVKYLARADEGVLHISTEEVRRLGIAPRQQLFGVGCLGYRVTSLIRNSATLGPCSRTMPRALRWLGGGVVSYERGTPVRLVLMGLGLGFGVWGLGSRVESLGFGPPEAAGLSMWGLGFRVLVSVSGFWFRFLGFGFG